MANRRKQDAPKKLYWVGERGQLLHITYDLEEAKELVKANEEIYDIDYQIVKFAASRSYSDQGRSPEEKRK